MTALRFALLLAALPVCSLGAGLLALRRARLDPVERLVAACGVSLVFLFLAAFGAYLLRLPPASAWVVTAVSLAALLASRSDLVAIARQRRARRLLVGWVLVLLWALLLLASVRSHSGALWNRDYVEHFERTRFFLQRGEPLGASFLDGLYLLPARPPLMNVVASHFLALCGARFEMFQVVFSFLNSLPLLACALVLPLLSRRGSVALVPLVCLVILNPSFAENATFPWTKLLSAFFVLAGTAFYLRGRRARSGLRTLLAFVFLAAGCLVHYGAAVYLLVVGAHAAFVAVRGLAAGRPESRRSALRLGVALVAGGCLLATWLGWSFAVFGPRVTLEANTTVEGYDALTLSDNLLKVGRNLLFTVVPHFLRPQAPLMNVLMEQPSPWGRLRDFWFFPYQVNFPTALGSVGGLVALGCFFGAWRGTGTPWRRDAAVHETRAGADRLFWAWWVLGGFLLGVAAHGPPDDFGVAHVTLQPLFLVGLAFLAVRLQGLPRIVRGLFVLGACLDLLLGIWLQFWLQSQPIVAWIQPMPDGVLTILDSAGLSAGAAQNAMDKQAWGLTFLGDALGGFRTLLLGGIACWSGAALVVTGRLAARGAGSERGRSRSAT